MTNKWGDEPAELTTERISGGNESGTVAWYKDIPCGGLTKLERACIDLKVPDPRLSATLIALILESRRLDYAGASSLVNELNKPNESQIVSVFNSTPEEK